MITRQPGAPAWRQLQRILLERITSGQYRPGALIPSESEMVREFGVSRNTIRNALRVLRYDDRIVTVPGRGTYVAERPPGPG